jgi:transcriptional regulator with XRE-family HTH domain
MNRIDILKEFRVKYNFTQLEASEKLGYSVRTIQQYEQGRRNIPDRLLASIENYSKLYRKKSGE